MKEKTPAGATGSLKGKRGKTALDKMKDRSQIANHQNQCPCKSHKNQYQDQARILVNHMDWIRKTLYLRIINNL